MTDSLLTELLLMFLSKTNDGMTRITPYLMGLWGALSVLELVTTWILITGRISLEDLVGKIMKISVIGYLIANWSKYMDIVLNFFSKTGMKMSGVQWNPKDPGALVEKGLKLTTYIRDDITAMSFTNIGIIIMKVIIMLVILIAFAFIAFQITITLVEFYFVCLFSLVCAPFAVNRLTSFLGEKAFGAPISAGVKVMVLMFMAGLAITFAAEWNAIEETADLSELIKQAFGSVALALLIWQVPQLVQGFLSGAPSLTAGSTVNSAKTIGSGAASVAQTAGSGAASIGRGSAEAVKGAANIYKTLSNSLKEAIKKR